MTSTTAQPNPLCLSRTGEGHQPLRERPDIAASPSLAPVASQDEYLVAVTDDLASLESEWREFQQRATCTVFQTYDWLHTWQRRIGAVQGVQPVIVTIRGGDGALEMILPLALETTRFGRALRFLGSDLCDYNAPLFAPDFIAHLCAHGIAALWRDILAFLRGPAGLAFDFVDFRKMPARLGDRPNPMLQLGTRRHPSDAHLVHLAPTWDEFYGRKSSSSRHRDRGKRKRIAKHGEVRLVEPADNAEREVLLRLLMAQKAESFARMGVENFFLRPGHTEFFIDMATGSMRDGVHLSTLDVGALKAAANFGLRFKGTFHHILASYAGGEIAKCGPGTIHLQELLRRGIALGDDKFDFTVGDERYKLEWADTLLALHDCMQACTLRGRLAVMAQAAFAHAKRHIKQTPTLWRAFTTLRARLGGHGKAAASDDSRDVH